MKLKRLLRRVLKTSVFIKRSIDEQFINKAKFLVTQLLTATSHVTKTLIPINSLLLLAALIHDIGFNPFRSHDLLTEQSVTYLLLSITILLALRFISGWTESKIVRAHLYSLVMVILSAYLYNLLREVRTTDDLLSTSFLWKKLSVYAGITFLFVTEASTVLRFVYRRSLNASFLFVASFAFLILAGSLLLMLPKATVQGIRPVDALFTSASAVCVTGLIVVDTATTFTTVGKTIILILIQIGGLGIMTFTTLLTYLAAGSVSYQSQLALRSMLYSKKMNNVIQLVSRIVIVTIFFEFIGVLLIQWSVGNSLSDSTLEQLFFAVFHSVSAFCNAGFSTLSNGLYEMPLRFNYFLQLAIAGLVILGGIGFPILFNFFSFIRIKITNAIKKMLGEPIKETFTNVISINSRLAVVTSFILLATGFISYLAFEQANTLSQHPSYWGKIVTSFFGAVTPRTAGFNTVDLAAMSLPTVMIYLLMMWIGASPGSTGGGIKTTTAAVSVLNLASIVRGKNRTEVFRTQISEHSINTAFAVMMVSLLIIGVTVLLIAMNDGDKGILRIAFEAFSAFSTVGLTLGITPALTDTSKIALIAVMFIGRVGALTVLMAFVHQAKSQFYRYPTEEIIF